jgi:hypothetical protein
LDNINWAVCSGQSCRYGVLNIINWSVFLCTEL